MAIYNQLLNKYRAYTPQAQEYLMYRAERIATMVWKKHTYSMPPLESCMARV